MAEDEQTPEQAALARQAEMEQMEASLRGIAASVVTIRRTLVDGGFDDATASRMAERAWLQFFPGQAPPHPFGFLLGGGPPA